MATLGLRIGERSFILRLKMYGQDVFFSVLLVTIIISLASCGDICKDKIDAVLCQDFTQKAFCDKDSLFYGYMTKNCGKSCGFCDEKREAAYSSVCEDNASYGSSCSGWKSKGLCLTTSQYYSFMKSNCPKTCAICTSSQTKFIQSTTTSACQDSTLYKNYCKGWKEKNLCKSGTQYFTFMKKYCPSTCGLCSSESKISCGKSSKKMNRVVGGKEANPHTWPWQVGLWYKGNFFCGGTLIHEQWIVTATHCVTGKKAADIKIVLGDHQRFENDGTEQEFMAIKVITHPSYSIRSQDNDIAMVKLGSKTTYNNDVLPACLPTSMAEASLLQNCFLTGWGRTGSHSNHANALQEVKMPVVTNQKCNSYNAPVGKTVITDNMVCAGHGYQTRESGCRGDSGGPLTCFNGQTWELRGVVSWGSSQCLGHEKYTVFTRVSRYTSWINDIINQQ